MPASFISENGGSSRDAPPIIPDNHREQFHRRPQGPQSPSCSAEAPAFPKTPHHSKDETLDEEATARSSSDDDEQDEMDRPVIVRTASSCVQQQQQQNSAANPFMMNHNIPEESYPTPIISNRGVLESPSSAFLVPLQLPAAAAAAATTLTKKTPDGKSSPTARFSSPNEPPIQCTWPTTSTTKARNRVTRVPPEISIPVLPTGNSSSTIDLVTLFPHLPSMTEGGALFRLLWHLTRLAASTTGNLPRILLSLVMGPSMKTQPAVYQHRKLRTLMPLQTPSSGNNSSNMPMGDGTIQGLPSFGQTCFLNATVQSLASLEAFTVYLQHVVHLVEQNKQPWTDTTDGTSLWPRNTKATRTTASLQNDVSHLLLDCLQNVNGITPAPPMIDTRPLLRQVATRHQQFRTMGSEQQDAEEFLMALLDSIVSEGEITSSSFVYPNSFVALPEPVSSLTLLWEEEEEDLLTVVSGHKERKKIESINASSVSSCSSRRGTVNNITAVSTISGDSMSQTPLVSNYSAKESLSTSSVDNSARHMHNGVYIRPEEKKQEDFEVHIPKVDSEEELMACFRSPPVHHVVGQSHIGVMSDDPSLSDMSSKERPLPTSLEIMRTTTTPLSPSPLTGWMGSSLQCRRCGHVRPIRNAPFGDWSVTPTAVADGWLKSGDKNFASRPCHLEDCLAEYVRVERVEDVECRNCTIHHEREKVMEEIQMTEGVIDGLLAKAKRQGKLTQVAGDSYCTALQQELHAYRCELLRLQSLDADDDQQGIFEPPSADNDNSTAPPLLRASARKCMFLTRLPAILCIHVQRRFYNPVVDRMTKVTQQVIFPEILDVAPYCAYGGLLGGNWAGSKSTSSRSSSRSHQSIPYRLQAVMEHRGGAFSGHYVCFRRDKTNGGWLYISDHLVSPVSWGEVQRCQAYMLFYEAA